MCRYRRENFHEPSEFTACDAVEEKLDEIIATKPEGVQLTHEDWDAAIEAVHGDEPDVREEDGDD